ncbi:sugar ABC transporter ATP-binding protein [Mesorhizobium sp.]|uniref:sugar ABC transporter ATP-binding protein n=1 Tax=Mesorhizobium sp. TaxID=1871066 RepID=UPI001203E666|nr:sugar ABC transporter ATP-binding protein [Mesorhizobium sp.]TIS53517.1 MAG: sugar ABC transporter ATP-binding protein [Mesorhizobium sp.]TIS86220.1 MAG: sugar ABC transporter ATP-binding protein [Mesorhizobium sp.]
MTNLIEMSHISKAFAASKALHSVSLDLRGGSVHALMGENGAGKSTLMKILAGVHQPDSGEIFMNGEKLDLKSPRDALNAGISTVFQEHSLLPNLSIAENMFLGREPTTRFGSIDYPKMNSQTAKALGELGLALEPSQLVSNLTIAERQFVEIAHCIQADASVLILDEPTAALNAADVDVLNRNIRRLRDKGKAIVYISHRMEEIFALCDTVTVLKDGALVGTRTVSDMTTDELIAMMVGRELQDLFPERTGEKGNEILRVENLKITETSQPLALTLHRGEIVALAGLEGQGQQRFLRSLIGHYHPFAGTVSIKGETLKMPLSTSSGVRHLQHLRVGFVPEDRKEEGLFLALPIAHNIAIGLHSRRSELVLARPYRGVIARMMEVMNIKAAGPSAPVGSLSGGNQQKVLLGRYLAADLDLLLVEEPTSGVDIGAKSEIYHLLRDFTRKGGAVLVLSRETIELIGLCDRIYVVHDDTIVAEMPAEQATEHKILDAALMAGSARQH